MNLPHDVKSFASSLELESARDQVLTTVPILATPKGNTFQFVQVDMNIGTFSFAQDILKQKKMTPIRSSQRSETEVKKRAPKKTCGITMENLAEMIKLKKPHPTTRLIGQALSVAVHMFLDKHLHVSSKPIEHFEDWENVRKFIAEFGVSRVITECNKITMY